MDYQNLLAQGTDIIGKVAPPQGVKEWGVLSPGGIMSGGGPVGLLNAIFKLIIALGGLYALLNIIIAGFGFISAGGDPKNVEKAWSKIWQSMLGLAIMAASFLLAAIIGWILFRSPGAILNPQIYGPGNISP